MDFQEKVTGKLKDHIYIRTEMREMRIMQRMHQQEQGIAIPNPSLCRISYHS